MTSTKERISGFRLREIRSSQVSFLRYELSFYLPLGWLEKEEFLMNCNIISDSLLSPEFAQLFTFSFQIMDLC